MNNNLQVLKPGQIRHPLEFPYSIMKCMEFSKVEVFDENENIINSNMFILTNDFPPPHFLIIDRLFDNYAFPKHPFCIVYMVTHSNKYDNVKITNDIIENLETTIDLSNSYVTRNKFLINLGHINKNKIFGNVNLEKLRTIIQY